MVSSLGPSASARPPRPAPVGCPASSRRSAFAGVPAITHPAGYSPPVSTEFAPITELGPTSTPRRIAAPRPTQTFRPITIGEVVIGCCFHGSSEPS
jgi:hypothetical protein